MTDQAPARITIARVSDLWKESTRRDFLRVAALGGVAVFLPSVFAACNDSKGVTSPAAPSEELTIDIGTDTGVLNFAYALEQLEAAFYSQVVQSFSASGLSAGEQLVLTDIQNHEVIHRDFLAQVLGTAKIPNLTTDFSTVNFKDRVGILRTAKTFEDIGVGAYNGAGKLLKDLANLGVAGKIVSVEARHAATIRDLLNPGSRDFAGDDVVDRTSGLDQALEPGQALGSGQALGGAGLFIKESIRFIS
ncbi:MAG: ferritin-like domain-containing protein [Gemmatimonadota bacterium]|nr:ferritin-like domain-containing protein [Gemmatimonadota bacterium]